MDEEDISTTQLSLLNKAKDYLNYRTLHHKQMVIQDPSCYLNSWASGSLGYLRLQWLHKGLRELPNYLYQFLRSILNIGTCSEYKIMNLENDAHPSYKYIVTSWCKEANFLRNGSFQCPYFNVNSKNTPDTLWFLLSLDNICPKKLNKNIRIFINSHKNHYSIPFVLKNIWKWATRKIIPVPEAVYAQTLASVFTSKILTSSIESIVMPYEAQPWQHTLNQNIKSFDPTIRTLGYLHSSLPPLPTDYIKREGEPDFLFVHGHGQKKILHEYLGWDTKNIHVIKSLRYQKTTLKTFSGKIFIPYDFSDDDFYIDLLEHFFKQMDSDIPPLHVQNHPQQSHSEKHIVLIKNIETLCAQYHSLFSKSSKRQVSIILGSTTCVLECLARDVEVIHILTQPVYESYNHPLWKDLQIKKISNHIFSYQQEENDVYIVLGESNSNLQDILVNG